MMLYGTAWLMLFVSDFCLIMWLADVYVMPCTWWCIVVVASGCWCDAGCSLMFWPAAACGALCSLWFVAAGLLLLDLMLFVGAAACWEFELRLLVDLCCWVKCWWLLRKCCAGCWYWIPDATYDCWCWAADLGWMLFFWPVAVAALLIWVLSDDADAWLFLLIAICWYWRWLLLLMVFTVLHWSELCFADCAAPIFMLWVAIFLMYLIVCIV